MTAPLETTSQTLETLRLGVRLEPDPTGLTLAPDIFSPRGLDAHFARLMALHDSSDPNAIAAALLGEYVFLPVTLAVTMFLAEARVPELEFWTVAVQLPELTQARGHGTGSIALTRKRLYGLADDPIVTLPGVRALPSRDALRRKLVENLEAHFKPIIAALQTRCSLRAQTIWAIIADAIVTVGLRAGAALGLPNPAQESERLVATAPFRGRSGVMTLHHGGREHHFLERGACCLRYRLPGQSGQGVRCLTCPLTTRDKRVAQIYASLDSRARQG